MATHERLIQAARTRDLNGRERAARAHLQAVRQRGKHPVARWRMAVTVIVEPLILAIVALLLWGMIGKAQMPLFVGIGLTIGLIILVVGTLLASAMAVEARSWQRDEAR